MLAGEVQGDSRTTASEMPSYHLFEKFGEKFVFDTTTTSFFRIDNATYQLLALALEMPLDDARRKTEISLAMPEGSLAQAVSEVHELTHLGLFAVPSFTTDIAELPREIEKRYSNPWTSLELALAEVCNLDCAYCYCSACRDLERKGMMSKDVARQSIDWLFEAAGEAPNIQLTLFGGEPLLNRSTFQFVMDYSQQLAEQQNKHVRYVMTTNGTLIDEMAIDYIKKHNFGLMVSLDGPKEVHDLQRKYHDGSGSFDNAASGIRSLIQRRNRVTVRCTVTNRRPRIIDLIHFFEDFGFSRITIAEAANPARPSAVDCDNETREHFDRQEEEEVLPWILERFESGRIPPYFPYGTFIREQTASRPSPRILSPFKCGACRGTTTVGADGTLFACHRFVGMSHFAVGSIQRGINPENVDKFWRNYNSALRDTCDSCWARTLCGRPCPWMIADCDGGFRTPEHWQCRLTRAFFERAAWVLWNIQTNYPEILKVIVSDPNGNTNAENLMEPAP